MTDQDVQTSVDDRGVATVLLNRPDVHNAFNAEVISALKSAFDDLGKNTDVRVVLLRGAGKSFSAGADLNWMKAAGEYTRQENVSDAKRLAAMLRSLRDLPKPSIALPHGTAMGGGVGLVATADIAIATKAAKFAFSEVKLGLTPATISPYVVEAIGARAARRYFLSGERFDADEAYRLGLVHQVTKDEDAMNNAADAIVSAILAASPSAVRAAKDLIEGVAFKAIDAAVMNDTAQRIAHQRTTDDAKEGLAAFLEKRDPKWLVKS